MYAQEQCIDLCLDGLLCTDFASDSTHLHCICATFNLLCYLPCFAPQVEAKIKIKDMGEDVKGDAPARMGEAISVSVCQQAFICRVAGVSIYKQ